MRRHHRSNRPSARLLGASALVAALGLIAVRADAGSGATRVVLDLSAVPREDMADLARVLPEWEEALNAGTQRITVEPYQVQAALRASPDLSLSARRAPASGLPECYTPMDELLAWALHLAGERPDLVRVRDAGDSFCRVAGGCLLPDGAVVAGSDLLVMSVSAAAPGADSLAPGDSTSASSIGAGRLWIDGGLHAREIPTSELVRAFVEHLVNSYGIDPQITYLLHTRELIAGVLSNPDGRALVELGASDENGGQPWQWRKNARPTGPCSWPPAAGDHFGVDLNRNHGFKWGLTGAGSDGCDETYRGSAPGSEPETVAFEAVVREVFSDQRGSEDADPAPPDATGLLLNYHNATIPGTVLVPWGWTDSPAPNDQELRLIAGRLARDPGYEVRNALYPVSGNTRDWGYGELGVPSFVIELEGDDFVTSCNALPQVIGGQIGPLEAALGLADRPYSRVLGPEVVSVTIGADQSQATARAHGTSPIEAAEAVVTSPQGERVGELPGLDAPEGDGIPMPPADGAFDSSPEDLVLNLKTLALPPGRHLVVVRALGGGHWGLARAAWVTITAPDPPTLYLPALANGPIRSAAGAPLSTSSDPKR